MLPGLQNVRNMWREGDIARVGCTEHGYIDAALLRVKGAAHPIPVCPKCLVNDKGEVGDAVKVVELCHLGEDDEPEDCEFCDNDAVGHCATCGRGTCDICMTGVNCPDCTPKYSEFEPTAHHSRHEPRDAQA